MHFVQNNKEKKKQIKIYNISSQGLKDNCQFSYKCLKIIDLMETWNDLRSLCAREQPAFSQSYKIVLKCYSATKKKNIIIKS